jgi:hypothetical protein
LREEHRVTAVRKALKEISKIVRNEYIARYQGSGYFSWWNFNSLKNFDEKEMMIDATMKMFIDRKLVFAIDAKITPEV